MHVYNIKLTVKMENKKKHYDPTKTLPKRKTKPEKKMFESDHLSSEK